MSAPRWSVVDRYLEDLLRPTDPALRAALRASRAAGLPEIQVSPLQGRFLHLLARLSGARRVLEIGTLGGYSTIWLARALPPGGRLVSLEISPEHARVARANLQRAGVGERVTVRVGPALETLPRLAAEGVGPFDLIFLDADKAHTPEYLAWAVRLGHPGTVIVVDNVVRNGEVANPQSRDPNVRGVRRMHRRLARDRHLLGTTIQTVGSKGYDGFTLALVTSAPRGPKGAPAARRTRRPRV